MILRLLAVGLMFVLALIGTALGNVVRTFIDKEQRARYTTPNTEDLIITGVLSNSLIAVLIAILTGGRRLWGAFIGGVVLTLVLGDQLDGKSTLPARTPASENGKAEQPTPEDVSS